MTTPKKQTLASPTERRSGLPRAGFPLALAALSILLVAPALLPAAVAQELELSPELEQETTRATAERHAPGTGFTMTGDVVAWEPPQLTVGTITGIEHVVVTERTRLPEELEALTTGARVAVDFQRNDQGVPIARAIRLETPEVEVRETTGDPLDRAGEEIAVDDDALAPTGLYDNAELADEEEVALPGDLDGDLDDEGGLLIEPEAEIEEADLLAFDGDSLLQDDDLDGTALDDDLAAMEAELAQLETAPATADRDRLPATASPLPLLALGGALALALALGLAILRFRRTDRNRALARSVASFEMNRRIHGVD